MVCVSQIRSTGPRPSTPDPDMELSISHTPCICSNSTNKVVGWSQTVVSLLTRVRVREGEVAYVALLCV